MSTSETPWGDYDRSEVESFVPSDAKSVLDVGCGQGGFGALLKSKRGGMRVVGIEPTEYGCSQARARLDHVIHGTFPNDVSPRGQRFDCIVFNDVLEHMFDPASALVAARFMLAPDGRVVASIPNIRHWTILVKLGVLGRWDYRDDGILDRTHVRFFTRSTMVEFFNAEQYTVERIVPINIKQCRRKYLIPWNPLLRRLHEFFALQYVIVASSESVDSKVDESAGIQAKIS
jgi:2-polyprenyl-3-methyl-5-hydroxy-6-metoxy-1,4-benzoquinol methylase